MTKKVLLGLCLLLSGCCSEDAYRRLLDSRIGMDENELIESIGNPSSVYDTNKKRSLEYKTSSLTCNSYGCTTHWCTTQYMIKNNKVDRWSYQGNSCCVRETGSLFN